MCLRCNEKEHTQEGSTCFQCDRELGKIWYKIYMEVKMNRQKENVKIEFKKDKGVYSKITTYKDKFISKEALTHEEYKDGLAKQVVTRAKKIKAEQDKLVEDSDEDFAKTLKKKKENHSSTGSPDSGEKKLHIDKAETLIDKIIHGE